MQYVGSVAIVAELWIMGDTVASWLGCLTREWVVWVWALARNIVLCYWARHFTLTVPLSTQVYKWVLANLMLGETCDGLASHPGGSRNTPSRFMPTGISSGLMGHLAHMQTLPVPALHDSTQGSKKISTRCHLHLLRPCQKCHHCYWNVAAKTTTVSILSFENTSWYFMHIMHIGRKLKWREICEMRQLQVEVKFHS